MVDMCLVALYLVASHYYKEKIATRNGLIYKDMSEKSQEDAKPLSSVFSANAVRKENVFRIST